MFGELAPKLRSWLCLSSSQISGTLSVTNGGTGAPSLTSNAIVKGNGTAAVISAGVSIDDNNTLYGYAANINIQTGTTYTLSSTDTGKVVECNNAATIIVTLPNNLPDGFCCTIVQTGTGQVTLSPATGATLNNRSSFTKTAGQWGMLTLYITSNSSGTSAVYIMGGDGA